MHRKTRTLQSRNYRFGVVVLLLAGVFLSSSGIIIRQIETTDGWKILFYRSVSFVFTVLIFIAWSYRGRIVKPFLKIGWPGAIVSIALALGFTSYLFAIMMTTIANVVFILSAGPFFSALLGWIVLKEKVSKFTWTAIFVAVAGIGLMFLGDLAPGQLTGNFIALSAAAFFAVMIVSMRKAGPVDMMPATCLAGVIAALLAAHLAEGLTISKHDLVLSVLFGSLQIGVGFILITLGTRSVPAAEVPLLALTETVLAPIWVWMLFDETPTPLALTGGAIVLFAVLAQALYGSKFKGDRFI
ncbi:MAG: DMT family transporter [SAR324 cluster bacterium]|nr:DMT family transporter [SAR324 cluster bacterium]